jgi:hypothetical protein
LRSANPVNGMPATRIVMTDAPTLGFSYFPGGYANIRLTGTGGPSRIPEDIRAVAIATAVRAWAGRQSGHTDVVGTNSITGDPVVSRWVAAEDKMTLERYKPLLVG